MPSKNIQTSSATQPTLLLSAAGLQTEEGLVGQNFQAAGG